MQQTIDVIYEENVLKPLTPIQGLREHQRVSIIIYSQPSKESLIELAGTITEEEAEEMQKVILEEFEKIEGHW